MLAEPVFASISRNPAQLMKLIRPLCQCLILTAAGMVALPGSLSAQTTFGYTGGSQTYTVPSGVTEIRIKTWGAGGGAAANISGANGVGGGGGYVQADVAVTAGQVLTVIVGRGGAGWNSTEGYAGGAYPNGGSATNFGGGGGGRSEVDGTGVALIAAGGGGGGYQFDGPAGAGGAGGASTGQSGGSSPNNIGGTGGTQTAGGTGGYGTASTGNNGAYEQGGAANGANIPGGAGADGYYGGGAAGGGHTSAGDSGGGGGGGSNYVAGSSVTATYSLAGSGSSPGNSSDGNRATSGYSAMGNYGAGQGATTAGDRGGNGEVVISSLVVVPQITSSLGYSAGQNQGISYQITASGNPTSYGATGLPSGLSVNTSTGLITGNVAAAGSYQSTLSASNSAGTGTATIIWTINAAVITTNASVSPASIVNCNSVTLTRDGTANFGIAWTENTIWQPNGQPVALGDMGLGSMGYTPADGVGSYSYQFRIVDNYGNYQDQWIGFTVTALPPPTNLQGSVVGSTFVTLSWSSAAGASSYNVYRNGTFIGSTSATSFTDSGVSPGTAYSYSVTAVDNLGNSASSSVLNLTTALPLELFTPLP